MVGFISSRHRLHLRQFHLKAVSTRLLTWHGMAPSSLPASDVRWAVRNSHDLRPWLVVGDWNGLHPGVVHLADYS